MQDFFGAVGATSCPTGSAAVPNPAGMLKGTWVDPATVPATPVDADYNIRTRGGAIYSLGDALYRGNLLDHGYPGGAIGLMLTKDGLGYSILTTSGAMYPFGDAPYFGNLLDHGYPGPAVACP